ncbi:MAG TPA: hypothetical protein VE690_03440 [Rhodopila sp.]|nr:hypothetical protein [Rhodopila sp.]
MKATTRLLLGLVAPVLMVVTAQAQSPQQKPVRPRAVPTASQTIIAPYTPPAPTPAQPPPLFQIGNLPARLWAPVPPPYDARANRNNAANPLWWDDSMG